MVYFLKDDRTENGSIKDLALKTVWHGAAGLLHIWCGVVMGELFGWQWTYITISVMWLVFDGSINTWVLKREWFYIGFTAQLDILQRKIAGWIHIDPRVLSAILKVGFLTGAVVNMLLHV